MHLKCKHVLIRLFYILQESMNEKYFCLKLFKVSILEKKEGNGIAEKEVMYCQFYDEIERLCNKKCFVKRLLEWNVNV